MESITITLPLKLMTRNEYDKKHWGKINRYKEELGTMLIYYLGRKKGAWCPALDHRWVEIHVTARRLQDPDNAVGSLKPLLDAMTHVGLIRDDSSKYITLTTSQEQGPAYRVEITVKRVEA